MVNSQPEWAHLQVIVDALVERGNVAVDGGSVTNQGGFDCRMQEPLDFDLVATLSAQDGHDLRVDRDGDRVDCLHCWAGIVGPNTK